MDALEEELLDYYGFENQTMAGLQVKAVPKPAELVRYEQVNIMGLPLVEGGVLDQPHIYLLEYGTCRKIHNLITAMREAQKNASTVSPQSGSGA